MECGIVQDYLQPLALVKNHLHLLDSLWSIWKDWFQDFLQPWWRNCLGSKIDFTHFNGLNFEIFFNHSEEITNLLVNCKHLEGLDFKIFFNHGEEISRFWPFWQDWIKDFLQPQWRNHWCFWVELEHLEGLNFKIFFNHGCCVLMDIPSNNRGINRKNCSSREKIWNFLKFWPGKPGNLLEFHQEIS